MKCKRRIEIRRRTEEVVELVDLHRQAQGDEVKDKEDD